LFSFFLQYGPNPIQKEIIEHFGITNLEYSLVYSIYTVPNIVLCSLGGPYIDRLGNRRAGLIFSLGLLLGHLVFMVSPLLNSYTVALCGRMLIGVFAELYQCVIYAVLTEWFTNKELGIATSITVLSLRLGVVSTEMTIPRLYKAAESADDNGVRICTAMGAGLLIQLIQILLTSLYNSIDLRNELMERESGKVAVKEEEKFQLKELRTLGLNFVIYSLFIIASFVSFAPYSSNLNSLMQTRFSLDSVTSGDLIAMTSSIALILGPLFGVVSDRTGLRGLILTTAMLLMALSHFQMALEPQCSGGSCATEPVPTLLVFYTSYSMYQANMWPILKMITSPH
jgi:nitrate/nitrite transporter NarK